MRLLKFIILVFGLVFILNSCGGGGSDSKDTTLNVKTVELK
jgi:hypothetical protein